jgi:hypothetical protein
MYPVMCHICHIVANEIVVQTIVVYATISYAMVAYATVVNATVVATTIYRQKSVRLPKICPPHRPGRPTPWA